MSFPNNNNYQGYGNFINSQNVYSSNIINIITKLNSFTISNNSNKNNNIIDPNKQIQYGAVKNNQPIRTQYIPNIIHIYFFLFKFFVIKTHFRLYIYQNIL